jgi:hypothetical protein
MDGVISYFRSFRLFHYALLAAISIASFTVVYYNVAEAACYSGTIHGRSCYRGYFNNVDDRGGEFVLPIISGGQALPAATIRSADSLYNLLRAAYDSGSNQRRTGAAFIYNTMMGGSAPGVGRTVTNAQWLDLRARLRGLDAAGKISWSGNISASINSYWQGTDQGFSPDGSHNDDAFYREAKNEPGITIRDYNNNIVYEILRRCANPMGNSAGLPDATNYTLTPHITGISPTTIEAGSKVSVSGTVDNQGDRASDSTQWEITQITVQPGQLAPSESQNGTVSATAPCQSNGGAASGNYFDSAVADCKNVAKGNGVFNLGVPAQNLRPSVSGLDVGDLDVGTRVCFALSVQPRRVTDTRWAHSKPICTVVGKKPKVQIWGGDVSVRGKIETSTSVKSVSGTTRTFGSWVEYGAFSIGTNSRFASGSGLSSQTNNNQAAWSKLTFANEDASGADAFGQYTTAANFRAVPAIAAYFGTIQNRAPVSGSVNINSLTYNNDDPILVRTAGDLTITGGTLPVGKSVVVIATGTVTISNSIRYTSANMNSVSDIPQIVIIANNINIRSAATQVDAWLVASGTINTCSNFSGSLTSAKCNAKLEVNGPVVTDRLLLNRTAGSGTGAQSGDPAEQFNLRADAFLWARLQASGSSKAQTVHSVELPPRF